MKTELKGWLADNTVTTDNKEDKILVLESAGNLTLSDVLDEMKKEDTGLRAETLKHAVDLFRFVDASDRLDLLQYRTDVMADEDDGTFFIDFCQ